MFHIIIFFKIKHRGGEGKNILLPLVNILGEGPLRAEEVEAISKRGAELGTKMLVKDSEFQVSGESEFQCVNSKVIHIP